MMNMVSLVNFCLRPMHNKAVMLFRRPIMIRTHLELDEAWDKIAKNAKRSTTATTNKIVSAMPSGATMPEKSMLIPAYTFEQESYGSQFHECWIIHFTYWVDVRGRKCRSRCLKLSLRTQHPRHLVLLTMRRQRRPSVAAASHTTSR